MQPKKITLTLFAFFAIAAIVTLLAVGIQFRNDRLQSNREQLALLHYLRFSLASSSEAISNAVLSKSDASAQQYGQLALQRIEEFKSTRQQLGKETQGAAELQLLQEVDVAFAKFESVCKRLIQSANQNSNRKAYALAIGRGSELVKGMDLELAKLLEENGDDSVASLHARGTDVCEARLALLRIQSIVIRHIFEATDEVMDVLETEMKTEFNHITSSLSSSRWIPTGEEAQTIAGIQTRLKELESIISEIVNLSRQNSNVHAEDLAMSARLEATLDCETRLNALEQSLHHQRDTLQPQGRGK